MKTIICPGTKIKIVVYILQNEIGCGWVYREKKEIKLRLPEKYGIYAGTLFTCTISEFDKNNQCYSIEEGSVTVLPITDDSIRIEPSSIKLKTVVLMNQHVPQFTLWSPEFDYVDYQEPTQLMMGVVYTTYVERMSIVKHNNEAHNDILFTVVEIPKESEDKFDYSDEFKEAERKNKEKRVFSSPATYTGQRGFHEINEKNESTDMPKNKNGYSKPNKRAPMTGEELMKSLKSRVNNETTFLMVKKCEGPPKYGEAFGLSCHSITVNSMQMHGDERRVKLGDWCVGTVKFDKQFYKSNRNLGFKVEKITEKCIGSLRTVVKNEQVYVDVDLDMDKAQQVQQMRNTYVVKNHIVLGNILMNSQFYSDACTMCKKYFECPRKVHAVVTYRNAYKDKNYELNACWEVFKLVEFMDSAYQMPQPDDSFVPEDYTCTERGEVSHSESGEDDSGGDDGESNPFARSPDDNASPGSPYDQPVPNTYQEHNRNSPHANGFTDRAYVSYQGVSPETNENRTMSFAIANAQYPAIVTSQLPNGFVAYCCSKENSSEHACFIKHDRFSQHIIVGGFYTFEAEHFNREDLKESGCGWYAITDTIQEYAFPPGSRKPIVKVIKNSVVMETFIDRSKKYPNPAAALRVYTQHFSFVRSAEIVPFARKEAKLDMRVLLSKFPHRYIDCEVRYDYMRDSDEHSWTVLYITDSSDFKFSDDLLDLCSSQETNAKDSHINLTNSAFQGAGGSQACKVFVTDDELSTLWRSKELKQSVKSLCYDLYTRLDDRWNDIGEKESVPELREVCRDSNSESSRVRSSISGSQYAMVEERAVEDDCRLQQYMQPSTSQLRGSHHQGFEDGRSYTTVSPKLPQARDAFDSRNAMNRDARNYQFGGNVSPSFAREQELYNQRRNNHGFAHQIGSADGYSSCSRVSLESSKSSEGRRSSSGTTYETNENAASKVSNVGVSHIKPASSKGQTNSSERRVFETRQYGGRPGWGVKPVTSKKEDANAKRF